MGIIDKLNAHTATYFYLCYESDDHMTKQAAGDRAESAVAEVCFMYKVPGVNNKLDCTYTAGFSLQVHYLSVKLSLY